jgi:hypothetical protein
MLVVAVDVTPVDPAGIVKPAIPEFMSVVPKIALGKPIPRLAGGLMLT